MGIRIIKNFGYDLNLEKIAKKNIQKNKSVYFVESL